ncbi:MAG: PEP-CTERM sorting domain-containing protein [Deltaproteobacteria bacterium]|nr:PEP-CTERM sorting domain-containing protein [Deltaproteobacteria bacterium]
MRKVVLLVIFAIILGVPGVGFSYSFSDNFNDGDLNGWTPKQGVWSNPGDHLLSSYYNYGIIWKDASFGHDQFLQVDAYFDDGATSKTAQLRLRSGEGGGSNSYFDHGYWAYIQHDSIGIYNTTGPGQHQLLGSLTGLNFAQNEWHTLAFSVVGLGSDTNLKLWVNNVLYIDVVDTLGSHDDGGYLALGSSNHINPQIKYDNISGTVDAAPVPEPATMLLLSSGLIGMAGIRRKFRKR